MTSTRSADAAIQPTAFLDSGILMNLLMFWDACKQAQVRLDQFAGMESPKAMASLLGSLQAQDVDIDALKATDSESVKRGMLAFNSLHDSAGGYIYKSSRVCWAETHHTLLEAQGLEHLARARVPLSLRRKRPQALYRTSLEQTDYDHTNNELRSFREALRLDYMLDVIDVEDRSTGQEIESGLIWDGAESVWSHMLMEVFDAYVCSAAMLARADVFVSEDPHLRQVFKSLRDPDDDWKATADSLMEAFDLASNAEFPLPLNSGATLQQASLNSDASRQ